jgi:WD repeat-containing protein 76
MVNVWPRPQRSGTYESFAYEDAEDEEREIAELKKTLTKLRVVARAKVTMNRVYCAQYHPEKSKDLIFFGGNLPSFTCPFTRVTSIFLYR